MRDLLIILANPIVLLALFCFIVWVLSRSPALRWTAKVVLLVGWGVMTVGVVLFVIVTIYVPRGEYWAALGALLAGSLVCFFWFVSGLPALWKTLRTAKDSLRLWEDA
jgi:hypothetical protein